MINNKWELYECPFTLFANLIQTANCKSVTVVSLRNLPYAISIREPMSGLRAPETMEFQ